MAEICSGPWIYLEVGKVGKLHSLFCKSDKKGQYQ